MATAEWTIPFEVHTTFSSDNLFFNTDLGTIIDDSWSGRQFALRPQGCFARRGVRAATDPVPQGDGDIFHERFTNGYEMVFAIQLWETMPDPENPLDTDGQIACDDVLCEMRDLLYGHIWALLRPPNESGRIEWTPSCAAARILDAVRLLSLQDPQESDEGAFEVTVTLDSPFPYAISAAETVQSSGGSLTLNNNGNVEFYPVFKVLGATGAWSITDNDTGKIYLYDSSRPGAAAIGGGDYAEIDMFRGGLIYLNGDGANLKPGVDVEASDILTVAAGGSSYTMNGATIQTLMHDAWA